MLGSDAVKKQNQMTIEYILLFLSQNDITVNLKMIHLF